MILKSQNYNDIEIEAEEFKNFNIVSHDTLKNLFYSNQDRFSKEEKIEFASAEPLEIIAKVTIKDLNTNVEYTEYGEANSSNLENYVSQQYPALMALNRGFGRAFIKALGLGEKVFTTNEIPPSQRIPKDAVKPSFKISENTQTQTDNKTTPIQISRPVASEKDNSTDEAIPKLDESIPTLTMDDLFTEKWPLKKKEMIYVGECAGYPYYRVRTTSTWHEFLQTIDEEEKKIQYPDPIKKDQLRRIKILAKQGLY